MGSGDGYRIMQLMPQNYMLKNGYNSKFYILPQLKLKKHLSPKKGQCLTLIKKKTTGRKNVFNKIKNELTVQCKSLGSGHSDMAK